MIWIIGGTSETERLLEHIRGRAEYLVTVATQSGQNVLPPGEAVIVGRMDAARMRAFIREHTIDTVIDLSHPYAVEVSRNARQVCREFALRYVRYVRKEADALQGISLRSIEECLSFLQTVKGCVFFTTGSKNIGDFQNVRGHNRFVYRVLPAIPSLQECFAHQVAMKDIAAMLGPFSEALNAAIFKEYKADYVVMKDSGAVGGTPAKLTACALLGITPIIIGREQEEGVKTLEEIIEMITSPSPSPSDNHPCRCLLMAGAPVCVCP